MNRRQIATKKQAGHPAAGAIIAAGGCFLLYVSVFGAPLIGPADSAELILFFARAAAAWCGIFGAYLVVSAFRKPAATRAQVATYQIDPKYSVECWHGWEPPEDCIQIVKTATGEPIPADEPLILFRARDRNALGMLVDYARRCRADSCTPSHMAGIENRQKAFGQFAHTHSERMKQPGVTCGL